MCFCLLLIIVVEVVVVVGGIIIIIIIIVIIGVRASGNSPGASPTAREDSNHRDG